MLYIAYYSREVVKIVNYIANYNSKEYRVEDFKMLYEYQQANEESTVTGGRKIGLINHSQ